MSTVERPYLGRYVRIEGPDGAGKSTQLQYAHQYAEENNIDAVFVREPGGTKFGLAIRNLVLHDESIDLSSAPEAEYALFAADRSYLITSVILPAIKIGRTVISDRGIESSLAYQAASGDFPVEKVWKIGELLHPAWYMQPDALAILSLEKAVWQKRMDQKLREAGHDKVERRRKLGERIFDTYQKLADELPYATAVNANQSSEKVFNDLRPILFGPEHR